MKPYFNDTFLREIAIPLRFVLVIEIHGADMIAKIVDFHVNLIRVVLIQAFGDSDSCGLVGAPRFYHGDQDDRFILVN